MVDSMKKIYTFFFFSFFFLASQAQSFSGQWKGYFTDQQYSVLSFGSSRCDYVLELECSGVNVTGFSYTYFTEGGVRYYSICKLEGTLNKSSRTITVKETERTKTNVPEQYTNCLQEHTLSYAGKTDGEEKLSGSWKPVSKLGNCGFGSTVLVRRSLIDAYPRFSSRGIPDQNKNKPVVTSARTPQVKAPVKTITAAAKPRQETANIKNARPAENNVDPVAKEPAIVKDTAQLKIAENPKLRRESTLLRTIVTSAAQVKIDIYDNGEVDGDSVSIYFNKKLILDRKMLSEKPISLTLNIEPGQENDVVMYAENLGTIPPNTALMVVTDGTKRYEVRITSDLQKSGALRFIKE